MKNTSYISAGLAAAVLAVSVSNGPAMAGDNPGGCLHLQGGYVWNICDQSEYKKKKSENDNQNAGQENPVGGPRISRGRGIWGTILPDTVMIERNDGFPGDKVGGGEGGGGGTR